jgi:hypothetical protein
LRLFPVVLLVACASSGSYAIGVWGYPDAPQTEVTTPGGTRLQCSDLLRKTGWFPLVVSEVDSIPAARGVVVVVRDGDLFYEPRGNALVSGMYDWRNKAIHVGFDRDGPPYLESLKHEQCHAVRHITGQANWRDHGVGGCN